MSICTSRIQQALAIGLFVVVLFFIDQVGITHAQIVLVDSIDSGFTASFTDPVRTETGFTAQLILGNAVKGKPANLSLILGESESVLVKVPNAVIYLDGTTSIPVNSIILSPPTTGGTDGRFYISISGLNKTKKYYYALASNINANNRYTVTQTISEYNSSLQPPNDPPDTPPVETAPQAGGLVPCDGTPAYPCRFGDILKLVNTVFDFFITWIILPITAIIIAYIGFLFLTSMGSPETKTKAKGIAVKALIGIIVILTAWLIVNTVLSSLLRKDTESQYNLLEHN